MKLLNRRQSTVWGNLARDFCLLLQFFPQRIGYEKVMSSALISKQASRLRAYWPVQVICWILEGIGVLEVRRRGVLGIRVDGSSLMGWTSQCRNASRRTKWVVAKIRVDLC